MLSRELAQTGDSMDAAENGSPFRKRVVMMRGRLEVSTSSREAEDKSGGN